MKKGSKIDLQSSLDHRGSRPLQSVAKRGRNSADLGRFCNAGHWWYTTLDKTVAPDNPKSNRAVVLKTALDQLVWAPFFTCVFFTFMCCLEVSLLIS